MDSEELMQLLNAGTELAFAGITIVAKYNAMKAQSQSEGRETNAADLQALMSSGDVKAAAIKAKIAQAELARLQSLEA